MNMLRPSIGQLITKNESTYALVIGTAKRARQIADELKENKQKLEEKPVTTAVAEFAAGKYKIIEYVENAEELKKDISDEQE